MLFSKLFRDQILETKYKKADYKFWSWVGWRFRLIQIDIKILLYWFHHIFDDLPMDAINTII